MNEEDSEMNDREDDDYAEEEDEVDDQGNMCCYWSIINLFSFNVDKVLLSIEYSMLDKQLDDLNSVLDVLEQKNDSIQSQLRALLENSREIRQNLAMERETTDTSDSVWIHLQQHYSK